MNAAESPEDAARRFATQAQEATEKLARYTQAIELWDNLNLESEQHVTEALLICKVLDLAPEATSPLLNIASNDLDWIQEAGLVGAFREVQLGHAQGRAGETE